MSIHDPELTIKLLACENAKKNAILIQLLKMLLSKKVLTDAEINEILAACSEAENETAMSIGLSPE